MEEEEEDKEIIKRVNDLWEKELKEPFSNFMNQKQEEILNGLEKKIDDLIKNKKLDEKNNNNNYYKDDDGRLRKTKIDFQNLNEPNLVFLQNTNPLINLILQCLSNIKEVFQYYLNPKREREEKILKKSKEDPNNTYLGPSFLTLLDHLWKSQQKEYAPFEIHKVLKKLMMNNYNTNDASIIINFILNKLNVELKSNQNDNIEQDNPYEHYNPDKIYEKFHKNFVNTQISNVFFASIKTKKKCLNCNLEKDEYYFETTPSINIYLTENNNHQTQKLSLEDHFKELKLLIEKDKEYEIENCIVCNSSQKKRIHKDVFTISVVLIIVINRDKDPNNTIYFKYPEIINSEKIVNNNMFKQEDYKNYELRAVIKKNKNNDNNFEYTAFYKNCIDNKWYLYNNQKIMSIESDYKKYVFDEKNTYVLIYYMQA